MSLSSTGRCLATEPFHKDVCTAGVKRVRIVRVEELVAAQLALVVVIARGTPYKLKLLVWLDNVYA